MSKTNSKSNELARADRARRVYFYSRYRRDKSPRNDAVGYTPPGCWPPELWLKLVRFCFKRSIDPDSYIQWALLIGVNCLGSAIVPSELLRPAIMNAYAADQPRIRHDKRQRKWSETHRFRANVAYHQAGGTPTEEALARALVLKSTDVSPLFRVAVARDIGGERFEKIAKVFEETALFQYQYFAKIYDEEWGEPWVQPWYRPAAAKLYDEEIYQHAFDEVEDDYV